MFGATKVRQCGRKSAVRNTLIFPTCRFEVRVALFSKSFGKAIMKTKKTRDERYPVMRFDLQGNLIDSNLTALPLLASWSSGTVSQLKGAPPEVHNFMMNCLGTSSSKTLEVRFSDLQISFDAVPYPEAGFIGLYGFDVRNAHEVAIGRPDWKRTL